MLQLWTNFIKYLNPTPSDYPSEVLDNVSWTQVLIYICKSRKVTQQWAHNRLLDHYILSVFGQTT